ncbi:hypothetical protein [Rhodococcus aetherivorans]
MLRVLPQRPLATFEPADPLQAVLEEVRLHNYSQFPIYEHRTYRGLLTTNCVARWLAHRFARDELVEGETVRDAFGFVEPHERTVHLSRKVTVPQAIKKLSPPADGSLPPWR